jgi:hypothetical protein
VAPVKLYSIAERQSALLAVCPSAVSARRVSPPSVSLSWLESAFAQAPTAVAPAAEVLALVPSARVAVRATEPAPVALAVPTGKDETRIDDQIHVASAAQLDQRGVRVQGTSGLNAKHDMTAPKPNGGVRGAPPRGRPV